jgi:hypothetical protein
MVSEKRQSRPNWLFFLSCNFAQDERNQYDTDVPAYGAVQVLMICIHVPRDMPCLVRRARVSQSMDRRLSLSLAPSNIECTLVHTLLLAHIKSLILHIPGPND